MAQVVLKDVTKIFDKKVVAVNQVNIQIDDKEFVILVGPSGCGKSTILRMIAGLEDVSSGQILIDDRLVNNVPSKDRDIAMVFQNYALYPHMTVFDNMAFGLKLRKTKKEIIKDRVHEAAEILGIMDLLERKPKALSGGQRQRVAVGRAIVRKPKVFLFDEPLSNLDAKLRVQMRTEISKLHKKLSATMIYVTHDQVEAMTMGDRIVVLKNGDVQQIDTPLNLYNNPCNQFVAGFIGSPPMNFLEGKIEKNKGMIFNEGQIRLKIPEQFEKKMLPYLDKRVLFGLRPDAIKETSDAEDSKDTASVQLQVEVVEPMGNEVILFSTTGFNQIVARLGPQFHAKHGDELTLVFHMDQCHFFDRETQITIL